MDNDRAVELLKKHLEDLAAGLRPDDSTAWRLKAEAILRKSLGDDHPLVDEFESIVWTATVLRNSLISREGQKLVEERANAEAFSAAYPKAEGVLEAAIYELSVLTEPARFATDASIDPELWQEVRHLIEQERWTQVASQTAIFVENKMRQWAGRPNSEVGQNLMTAVLGEGSGTFPLGQTSGETQGWHRFGMGFAMALRNVDTHRIQSRPDLKRYALGVLGAGSLLLTQLRYEHGNRFKVT